MTDLDYRRQAAADFAASLTPDEWQQFVAESRGAAAELELATPVTPLRRPQSNRTPGACARPTTERIDYARH